MTKTLRFMALSVLLGLAALLVACGDDGAALPAAGEHAGHLNHASHVERSAHAAHAGHESGADHAATHDHDAHAHHGAALPASELPGTSLFHLSSAWTDEDGEAFALPDLRGRPSVFVMFYGDCTTACPLLVKAAEDIEAALPDDLAGAVSFVMVTFATDADTPAKLKAYAQSKDLDRAGWHWLVGSPLQTRQLATLLGVQYRDLGNGMFAHSNVVTVLDSDGVPTARLEGLGVDLGPAVDALRQAN